VKLDTTKRLLLLLCLFGLLISVASALIAFDFFNFTQNGNDSFIEFSDGVVSFSAKDFNVVDGVGFKEDNVSRLIVAPLQAVSPINNYVQRFSLTNKTAQPVSKAWIAYVFPTKLKKASIEYLKPARYDWVEHSFTCPSSAEFGYCLNCSGDERNPHFGWCTVSGSDDENADLIMDYNIFEGSFKSGSLETKTIQYDRNELVDGKQWVDVSNKFNHFEVPGNAARFAGKHVYYLNASFDLNAGETLRWRINYTPKEKSGKWDLVVWTGSSWDCILNNSCSYSLVFDPSWLSGGWDYRKKITIDNTNVDSDLSNFPLLVKIDNDQNVGEHARLDGYDIRFTSSDGTTLLSYDREDFNKLPTPSSPVTVATTTSTYAININDVPHVHYANGYYWAVFNPSAAKSSSDSPVIYSSSDGQTWTSQGDLADWDNYVLDFCYYFKGNYLYFGQQKSTERSIYKISLNSNGTITKGTKQTTQLTTYSHNHLWCAVDSSDYMFLGTFDGDPGVGYFSRSTSSALTSWSAEDDIPNGGDFTASAAGWYVLHPLDIEAIDSQDIYGIVVAWDTDYQAIEGIKYDASAGDWESDGTVIHDTNTGYVPSGSGPDGVTIDKNFIATVAESDGEIHLFYKPSLSSHYIVHRKRHTSGTWETIDVLSDADHIAVSRDSSDNLYFFYSIDNGVYMRKYDGSSWTIPLTIKAADSNPVHGLSVYRAAANNEIGVLWVEGASSPYNVKFAKIDLTSDVAVGSFWVKVPAVSSSSTTDIYIYYGKSDASDGEDAANVWDSDFKGVYHFPDGTTLNAEDSTSNNNDGTISGTVATSGKIDGAGNYDGTDDYIKYTTDYGCNNVLTISVLFKTTGGGSDGFLFQSQDAKAPPILPSSYISTLWVLDDGKVRGELWIGSVSAVYSSSGYNDGDWHIATITGNTNIYKLYVDGSLAGSKSGTIDQSWWDYSFIGLGVPGTREGYQKEYYYFDGVIDETRISNIARSDAWIKFEAKNILEADNELSFGSEEQAPTGNNTPDLNVWQIDGFDVNAGLPQFSYASDGNLSITFWALDADQDDLNANIYYDTTQGGQANIIVEDINLSMNAEGGSCDSNDSSNGMVCSWDWNISGIADNNYWITITVNDGTDTNTMPTATSFRVNPAVDFTVIYPNDVNIYWAGGSTATINWDVNSPVLNATDYLIDINYSTSSNEGTGTVIVNDGNVASTNKLYCDSNNLATTTTCHYDWTMANLDDNYFILISMSDLIVNKTFDASDNKVAIDSTAPTTANPQPATDSETTATTNFDFNVDYTETNPYYCRVQCLKDGNEWIVDANATINEANTKCEYTYTGTLNIDDNMLCQFTLYDHVLKTSTDLNTALWKIISAALAPTVVVVSPNDVNNLQGGSTVLINFDLNDADSNAVGMLIDLNYNASAAEGGTVIVNDGNVASTNNLYCDSNDLSGTGTTCHFVWSVPSDDANYFIIVKVDDGTNTATDFSDNSFRVDSSAPTTTSDANDDTWQSYDANIHLTCSDDAGGSGCLITKYRINNGSWVTFDTNVLISAEGSHTLDFNSTDIVGNVESMNTVTIKIDKTAPITTSDENNVWQAFDANIHLTCDDNSLSGCNVTRYRIDGGSWQVYDTNILVSSDGNHQIDFNSSDNVGNEEVVKTLWVAIDKTPPTFTSVVADFTGLTGYTYDMTPLFTLTASDADSGLDKMQFSCNGVDFDANAAYSGTRSDFNVAQAGLGCLDGSDGNVTVTVQVFDLVGNSATASTISFVLDTTVPVVSDPQPSVDSNTTDTTPDFNVAFTEANVHFCKAACVKDGNEWLADANAVLSGGRALHTSPVLSVDDNLLCQFTCYDLANNSPSSDLNTALWMVVSGNVAPDSNVISIAGVSDRLPSEWSYARDLNLTITFFVIDTHQSDENFNMWYSSSQGAKENLIVSDVNLSTLASGANCDGNDVTLGMTCSWDFNISGIADGNYFIDIEVRDAGGLTDSNSSEFSAGFLVDNTAPTGTCSISSWTGMPQYTNDSTPLMDLTYSSDANGMQFSCDGSTYDSIVAIASSYSGFNVRTGGGCVNSDGNKQVRCRFEDSRGNLGSASTTVNFYEDETAPTFTSIVVSEWTGLPGYTTDATPSLTLTASDAGAGLWDMNFSCNNSVFDSNVVFSSSYSGFNVRTGGGCVNSDGNRIVYAQIRDLAGNKSDANTSSFVEDETAPAFTSVDSNYSGLTGYTYEEIPKLTLTVSDSFILRDLNLSCDDSSYDSNRAFTSIVEDFNVAGSSYGCRNNVDGNYVVYVQVRDNAGNLAKQQTISTVLDRIPPSISNPLPSVDSNTSDPTPDFNVDFVESNPHFAVVKCFRDGNSWDADANATLSGGKALYTLSPALNVDGNALCQFTLYDLANNSPSSDLNTALWMVIAIADTDAPVLIIFNPVEGQDINSNTVDLVIGINDASSLQSAYFDLNDGCAVSTDYNLLFNADNNKVIGIANCKVGTDINIHAYAEDSANNYNESWVTFTANFLATESVYAVLSGEVYEDDLNIYTCTQRNSSCIVESGESFNPGKILYLKGKSDSTTALPTHYFLDGRVYLVRDNNEAVSVSFNMEPFVVGGYLYASIVVPSSSINDQNFWVRLEAWDSKRTINNDVIRGQSLQAFLINAESTAEASTGLNWKRIMMNSPESFSPEQLREQGLFDLAAKREAELASQQETSVSMWVAGIVLGVLLFVIFIMLR